ncbi:MAG: phytoene desaturase family protein [Actinomycetota bacterium]|nr:phytoene desaturase family protein [Actinomycetota bacterium]
MARVVVVGAGLGGLAAAARLAALGHDVTVCEQAPEVGGKLGLLTRAGFTWDTGPSLLTLPQVFRDLFADTGDPLDTVLDVVPVEPIARTRFADGTVLDSSTDLPTFRPALDAALGPPAGDEWAAFLARAERVWEATRGPFLETPLDGTRSLLSLAVSRPRDLPLIAPWRTLRRLGEASFGDPRLRVFLDRYATYTGSDPRRAPAALATVAYAEQAFGAWYVRGGLYRLAEATRDRALERGARLRVSTDVTAVETLGGRVSGVRLADGGWLPADVVVANADAAHLYGDLVADERGRTPLRALGRAVPSLSGFVLLLGLWERTPGLAHHTVLFPDDYDAEFDAVFGTLTASPQPVRDPTLYISAPRDPAVLPADATRDSEAWFVLVNAPRHDPDGGVDWDAPGLADAYAEHLLDRLEARGLAVRDRVVVREVLTPADLARRTRAVGGSIYGTSSNGTRAAFLRPANRSPVPGLFLVGGSSHPGGGLPLVTLSARIVAGLVGAA